MRSRILWLFGLGMVALTVLYAFQRPFREYPGVEYNDFPLPQDYREKTEWAFARLMYPEGRPLSVAAFATGARATRCGRRIIRGPIGISRKPCGD